MSAYYRAVHAFVYIHEQDSLLPVTRSHARDFPCAVSLLRPVRVRRSLSFLTVTLSPRGAAAAVVNQERGRERINDNDALFA